ncbi:MAG: hypothetical protein OXP69_01580 [Spirochaetaceae bacterium]|nr:hypothetical protein [Spirochaetaceae bacterium]
MNDPGLMVVALLAALSVTAAGVSFYLMATRRRKQLLLTPLIDPRRLRR